MKPDLMLVVKKPTSDSKDPDATVWLPVGNINLWRQPDGRLSGRVHIYALGEFMAFEKVEEPPL